MKDKYQKALDNLVFCKMELKCFKCNHKKRCTMKRDSDILQELVDKEKPMKVFLNKEYKIIQCPNCKVAFTDYIKSPFGNTLRYTRRCDNCGQVLDWSIDNETSG